MDGKLVWKQVAAAVSGFITGACGVLLANSQAPARQILIAGLLSAASTFGFLHVPPNGATATAETVIASPAPKE
jgi:hypothetical protein